MLCFCGVCVRLSARLHIVQRRHLSTKFKVVFQDGGKQRCQRQFGIQLRDIKPDLLLRYEILLTLALTSHWSCSPVNEELSNSRTFKAGGEREHILKLTLLHESYQKLRDVRKA